MADLSDYRADFLADCGTGQPTRIPIVALRAASGADAHKTRVRAAPREGLLAFNVAVNE